tara:strand:- start:1092 stop:1697 length:606 start_codon:yes stop_codon:yes gene_type:complete
MDSEFISLKTSCWGPPAWFFLHSVAFSYPKIIDKTNPEHIRKQNAAFNFYSNLGELLPCPICGESYSSYLNELPLNNYLDSRKNLFLWIYNIHNKVNDKLGVPSCKRPSFNETIEHYSKFIANNGCKATTPTEKAINRQKGCKEEELIDYKCVLKFVDKSDNDNIEYFGRNNKLLHITIISIFIISILIIFRNQIMKFFNK